MVGLIAITISCSKQKKIDLSPYKEATNCLVSQLELIKKSVNYTEFDSLKMIKKSVVFTLGESLFSTKIQNTIRNSANVSRLWKQNLVANSNTDITLFKDSTVIYIIDNINPYFFIKGERKYLIYSQNEKYIDYIKTAYQKIEEKKTVDKNWTYIETVTIED